MKKLSAILEKLPVPSHHINFPITKPIQAPKIEPKLHIRANLKIFNLLPIKRGIKRDLIISGENLISIKN